MPGPRSLEGGLVSPPLGSSGARLPGWSSASGVAPVGWGENLHAVIENRADYLVELKRRATGEREELSAEAAVARLTA